MGFEGKIEKEINELAQARWKEIVEDTGAANLTMPIEYFAIMRQYFQLAYQQGYNDLLTQMQEIYDNDADLFITIFENDNLN